MVNGDVVKVNRPGWYGHGMIGKVVAVPENRSQIGIFVKFDDGSTYAYSSPDFLKLVKESN